MSASAKDRLIIALSAQLRAERDTREALAHVIANGQLDQAVLVAMLTDPIPVVTREDLADAERLVAALRPRAALARQTALARERT